MAVEELCQIFHHVMNYFTNLLLQTDHVRLKACFIFILFYFTRNYMSIVTFFFFLSLVSSLTLWDDKTVVIGHF